MTLSSLKTINSSRHILPHLANCLRFRRSNFFSLKTYFSNSYEIYFIYLVLLSSKSCTDILASMFVLKNDSQVFLHEKTTIRL